MPHIDLPEGYPGVRSLFMYSPATAHPLNLLVQTLLHDPETSTLTPGERELIAAYTSGLNRCKYCSSTHGAIAKHQLGGNAEVVNNILHDDVSNAEISDKLKALLQIAAKVQKDGKSVSKEDIENAKAHNATDKEIHDTVLIAATFCMFNRYVDGLGTWAPDDDALYNAIGKQRATEGYMTKPFIVEHKS
ncbi:MAG: peroxidase-related enzyme [Ginsengibacter sp.]